MEVTILLGVNTRGRGCQHLETSDDGLELHVLYMYDALTYMAFSIGRW